MGKLEIDDQKNTEYSGSITALKGIGIFIIAFFWHYYCFFNPNPLPLSNIRFVRIGVLPLYEYGFLFVELFLMLSGFGMMRGYSAKIQNDILSFKEYIFKRLKKIYPLHFVTLVYVIIFQLVYYSLYNTYWIYYSINWKSIILNLLLLQQGFCNLNADINGPSWTLSVCFLLYCVFYLLRKCLRKDIYFFLAMASLSIIFLPAIIFKIDMPIYTIDIARGILCFTIGCLIEYAASNKLLSTENFRGGGKISFCICVSFYIAQSLLLTKVECWQLLYIFIFLPCVIVCALTNNFVSSILGARVFQILGKVSMEIYLLHFPVALSLMVLFSFLNIDYDASKISFWVLYMVITIAASCCVKSLGRFLLR